MVYAFAANEGLLDDVDNKDMIKFKKDWFEYFAVQMGDLIKRINNGEALADLDKDDLTKAFESFKKTFVK